jgi:hypothetical protein
MFLLYFLSFRSQDIVFGIMTGLSWFIEGLIPCMRKKYICPATVSRLVLESTLLPAPKIQGLN